MGSAEARTKITVENALTTRQIMQGRFSDFDVQGTSIEADGDRLLLDRNFEGALGVYLSIEAPGRPLREKMAFALWTLGNEKAWAILGDGLDLTTEDGIAMELRAFAMTMFKSGASDKPIADLVDHVLARKDQLPSLSNCCHRRFTLPCRCVWIAQKGYPFTQRAVLRPSPHSRKCPSRTLIAWKRLLWPARFTFTVDADAELTHLLTQD